MYSTHVYPSRKFLDITSREGYDENWQYTQWLESNIFPDGHIVSADVFKDVAERKCRCCKSINALGTMKCFVCPSFFIARDFTNELGLNEDPPEFMLRPKPRSPLPPPEDSPPEGSQTLTAGNLQAHPTEASSSGQPRASDAASVVPVQLQSVLRLQSV